MADSDSDGNSSQGNLPVDRLPAEVEDDNSYYEKGNNNSRIFFARMQASHKEAYSIKRQCTIAASASPARRNEERMSLDLLRVNVSSSRRSAEVARNAVNQQGSCRQVLGQQPKDLGHLTLPTHSRDSLSLVETEFVLPGAIQCSKDREETVKDLTQPFITGTRSMAPDLELFEAAAAEHSPLKAFTDVELDSVAVSGRENSKTFGRRSFHRQTSKSSSTPAGRRSALEVKSKFLNTNWAVAEADGDSDLDVEISRPALRFKVLTQFNDRFRPGSKNDKRVIHEAALAQQKLLRREPDEDIHHPVLGWINHELKIGIQTKKQLEVAFPIVILTILDAVFSKRVKWIQVDWDFRYVGATAKNYVVLQALWKEVNMDSSPDFRRLPPFMRLQSMHKAQTQDRLHFLALMQRWFYQRIPDSDPYNAMGRRRQYFEQSRLWGRPIQFPSWVHFDPEQEEEDAGESELRLLQRHSLAPSPQRGYTRMPEFQRLMNFLGNEGLPSM